MSATSGRGAASLARARCCMPPRRTRRACCASWTCLAGKMAVENGEDELDDGGCCQSSAQTLHCSTGYAPGGPSTASETEKMRLQPSSYSQPRRGCICWSATPISGVRRMMLRSSWAGTAPAARAAVHSCACGSSPSMLRMGSRRPICQRRPPAWAVTNAGLHLELWFVSLDSEPALGTVVNLANSQLQHLFL